MKYSQNTELIRISNRNEIITIKDKSKNEQIKKAIASISYINENLNMQTTKDDYTIWLENSNLKERVYTISIWSNNGEMVLFNAANSNYGYLKNEQKTILKEILNNTLKSDL